MLRRDSIRQSGRKPKKKKKPFPYNVTPSVWTKKESSISVWDVETGMDRMRWVEVSNEPKWVWLWKSSGSDYSEISERWYFIAN